MGECPLCGESTNKSNTRLIQESCGHSKCRLCLINEDNGCSICEGSNGDISCTIESIGNFDYRLPATTISNYKELHSTPRKLDFNKIPDDFIDCSLDVGKLPIDNSINQNLGNVAANILGPEKVDIGTETESILTEKDIQSQTIQENTHSSLSQVIQTPMEPVTKVPEVFANTINNNNQPHQETPVVQNTNFIPVTQRADGRQFITIAFIANNSPNKNQQVVTPLLNQCLPALANVAAVQRPGVNQCIPVLGNINALQNGNQFIIRNPNIVQNLVANQSVPVMGNLNTMQNLPANQPLSIVANLNTVKNLIGNQPLPPLTSINSLQSSTKSQSFPTTGSQNVVHKVVGYQSCQVTQTVPREIEEQSAPIEEKANTARKQTRTRGLPRIKNVKNVNIVQKSATNQSDTVNSQIDKNPVQLGRGKKRRKELPVYLISSKLNEQKNNKKSSPIKSPQVIGCTSPDFKLEDYILFNNKPHKASNARNSEIQTEKVNDTQSINKPSESVINENSIVSDQFNCTVLDENSTENKVDESEQENKVSNNKTYNEKNTTDISIETDECKEHQDLSVIFNIRDENKQTVDETIDNEKEKINIPNGEASNKEEYQNLDVLFDIIEKESKKLNGAMFDKEDKSDFGEGFDYEANQKLHNEVDNGKDDDNMLNQEANMEPGKDQILNNGIADEQNEDQYLNGDIDNQNKKIENLNEEIVCNKEESRNLYEITYDQEQNLIEELPIQNRVTELLDGKTGCKEEKHLIFNTNIKDHKEENKFFGNILDGTLINDEVDSQDEIQSLNKKIIVGLENKSGNQENEDVSPKEENNKHSDEEIMSEEDDNYIQNRINNEKDNDQYMNEKIDDEEKTNHIHYEDISDDETGSGESPSENQELKIPNVENNDEKDDNEHLNKKTVEEESIILNRETVEQDDERNQSLIETHEKENISATLYINKDLPASEANDFCNSKLEQTYKPEILHKKEQSLEKDSHILNIEGDRNEENDNLAFEVHTDKEEITLENVHSNLSLTEMEKSEDENLNTVAEDTQYIGINERRERKKKVFSDYEINGKLESSDKNKQILDKTPRGRPKKSLLNTEQLNKSNEIEGKLDISERQVLEVNVQIHNQEVDNNVTLDNHDQDKSMDSNDKSMLTYDTKKPRGPKCRNVLLNFNQHSKAEILHNSKKDTLQLDIDAISPFVEKDESDDQKLDTVNENNHLTVIKMFRDRQKKSTSISEQQNQSNLSGVNVEPIIKKLRGRPRKADANSEQLNKSNIAKEVSFSSNTKNLIPCNTINNEENKEQHERNEGKASRVLDRENFSQHEIMQGLRVDMDDKGKENLHLDVITNVTCSHKSNLDARKSIIVNDNKLSIVSQKPRGRPKKSSTNLEKQSQLDVSGVNVEQTIVKKSRGRPRKFSSLFKQQNDINISQKTDISNTTKISNLYEPINNIDRNEQYEAEGNKDLSRNNFSKDETLQVSSIDIENTESENPYSNNIINPTFSDKNKSEAEKSITLNSNETLLVTPKPRGRPKKSLTTCNQQNQSDASEIQVKPTIVKKSRGRPKKSLSMFEIQNNFNTSEETEIFNLRKSVNKEENKEQHISEGNQNLDRDNFSNETLLVSNMNMEDRELENRYSNYIASSTFNDEDKSKAEKSFSVNSIKPLLVTPKSRGRPKKSLTIYHQQSQFDASNAHVEPTIVKKSRGRPKKSLSMFERPNDFIALQETRISNLPKSINREEIKEQHESEGSQDLDRDHFSNETLPVSSMNMEDGEPETLHSNYIGIPTSNDKNKLETEKLIIVNSNAPLLVTSKPRGRPKKSLISCNQQSQSDVSDTPVEPTIVKKSRGRPKKSLSLLKKHNNFNITQNNFNTSKKSKNSYTAKISNLRESVNKEESKEQHESEESQDLDQDNFSNETLPVSNMNMEDGEPENPYSNDIPSLSFSDENKSETEKSITANSNTPLLVTSKPKGRPKKSLINCNQQSQSDASDAPVEPTIVKKSRGRPRKILSLLKKHNNFNITQETDMTEISNLHEIINNVDSNEHYEAEGNQNLNRQNLELSQHSSVIMNENLQSDIITSSTSKDKNNSDNKTLNVVYENEQGMFIKKPLGRPIEPLSNIEKQKEPTLSDADTRVVKKLGDRPKISLSKLEQSNVLTNLELGEKNDIKKDQAQCLYRAIDKEQQPLDWKVDSHGDEIQSLTTSSCTEADENSILETEINTPFNQNSIEDKLEIAHQSKQVIVIKKARGRPKKEKSQEAIIKKIRGRPKKENHEQQNESNVSQNKEYQTVIKLSSYCADNNDKKNGRQGLDGNAIEEENKVLDNENSIREESSQVTISNDENRCSLDEFEEDKIDSQKQTNDFLLNGSVSDKMEKISTQSIENDKDQSKQQNYNEVFNEGENTVIPKDSDKEVEEKDSQDVKSHDDENKENKEKFSEKDDAKIENITPVAEEQDLEKLNKINDEAVQNSTPGRKYKKFDKINTQVIVESSKRKRKPKVLLYENEDLEISPVRKKKKELNKSSHKNKCETIDNTFMKKTQVYSSTHVNKCAMNTKQNIESTEIMMEKVNIKHQLKENKSTSLDNVELDQNTSFLNVNPNSMDIEMNYESNFLFTDSSPKDEDTKEMKRNRRPKTLLYENEDLKIVSKVIKKKRVEFLLPESKDSIDSCNFEEDDRVTEDNNSEVVANECELTMSVKKRELLRKSKAWTYDNKRLRFMPLKEKDIKFKIEKKDLMIMKKFEIKLEPIVVLERNIDWSIIKKYSPDNNLRITHEQERIHVKRPKSTLGVKRPRGRPKLLNGPTAPKTGCKRTKVLSSKCKNIKSNKEKKRPGRPSKDYSHIIPLPGKQNTFQCTICLRSFKHYVNKTPHLACVKSTLKSYKCEFCSRKFYHKTHLDYHERSHKGEKPFCCELCGKKFLIKGKLNRHLLIHKYTQDLECNECGKKFVSKEYLKSHLLSHVESSFVFRCNQCPKSFTMDANRRRHELSHSPVALFKCLHCPKSFKTKYEVAKHIKIHQKIRPFACDQCGKAFLTKFEVKRHSVTHSGEKKYTCCYCQQQFGRIDNYTRHMLHHHPIKPHEHMVPERSNSGTPKNNEITPSKEEKIEKTKDNLAVKPKKISRTPSNPVPMPINFIQRLTPPSVPNPHSMSQNYELASVIHETLPDLNNAVPVINAPINTHPPLSLTDPIPLEQAFVLNRQIEEKIYSQSSFCEFPGLTRRITVANHKQSFTSVRRNSSESNSNSNDGTSFLTINQEQNTEQQDDNEITSATKDIHVHWRRRTAETLKSKIDQNK
ncbi:uncharacterized protein LOC131666637 [Phymastichus coffea]|uniref:uncharacterized protein LOC131666637 n=1 Tax=Phymastichus coffea TaxID=108790 RepID=UPI00273BFFCF|nr:uncharacterized protein LOC131666637 [Phymastichus coffea]